MCAAIGRSCSRLTADLETRRDASSEVADGEEEVEANLARFVAMSTTSTNWADFGMAEARNSPYYSGEKTTY